MDIEGTIPLTVPDAVEMLYQRLEAADRVFILNRNNTPAMVHFHVGMHLRNAWKLWDPRTPVVQDFISRYQLFGHADDVSGTLLEGLWVRAHGADAAKVAETCAAHAEVCRAHWIKEGVDPLTGQQCA